MLDERLFNDSVRCGKPELSLHMVTDNHAATSLYHDSAVAQIVNKRESEHPFEIFEGWFRGTSRADHYAIWHAPSSHLNWFELAADEQR